MKRINSLSDLLMEELADLLNAEAQLIEALPKMQQASQSLVLKMALEAHFEVTKEHARRLRDIFSNIGQDSHGKECRAIKLLIEEIEEAVHKTEKCQARDVIIIDVMRRVEKYEINRYQTAREHADDLGHTRIVELLSKTLDEEHGMDLHLSELAQNVINVQASGGFYIPEGKFKRKGIKKNKGTDISRFISEGNPNIQEPQESEKEKRGKNPQDPEEQGDLS